MNEITLEIKGQKPTLTDEEFAGKIAAQRAAIPDHVDNEISEFLAVDNVTIAQRLLSLIESVPDPEEGFSIWQNYYATGNDSVLKEALLKQKLPASFLRAKLREEIKNEERRGEARPSITRFLSSELRVLYTQLVLKILAPTINHTDTTTEMAFETFSGMRRIVHNVNKNNSPVTESLHDELKVVFDEKLTTSLASLRATAKDVLLPPEVVLAAREHILQKSLAWFDRLAHQSLVPADNAMRENSDLSFKQIPESQRFGIECEGFFQSDDALMSQMSKLYVLLHNKEFQSIGIGVRFPLMSLLPKNDNKYEKWAVTMDGSVVNPLKYVVPKTKKGRGYQKIDNTGLEIVSPILNGPMGGIQAYIVLETLKATGFRSNQSCGFHVHAEVADASLDELKNLAKAFVKNESRIDSFIDPQRRATQAAFAKSVATIDLTKIDEAQNIPQLIEVMNHGDRNSKLDMTNLGNPSAPQTVQYRGEGGAGYLGTAMSYTVLMVNFTQAARKDPDLTIDALLERLYSEEKAKPENIIATPQMKSISLSTGIKLSGEAREVKIFPKGPAS